MPAAIAALEPPPYPYALQYVHRMAVAVHGRSGIGMSGFAPLNPLVLESMARLHGWTVDSLEAEAIFVLDAIMSHPGDAGSGEERE